MRTYLPMSRCAAVALSAGLLAGCGGNGKAPVSDSENPPAVTEDEHAHPTEGPHGGGLVELGNEEFHAELVHDDKAETVTIYILDAKAESSVAIDAAELTVNLKHDGKGEQFKLASAPDKEDPKGKSSRFVSSDKELAEDLDHEDVDAELVATIEGKQYRGKIDHHHDDGDDDDDDHEKKHDHGAKESK